MCKKLISCVLALGLVVTGASAFACGCGEEYRTYEYTYYANDQHTIAYSCSNVSCDDPFTVVRNENCTYEWVEYEDPNTWVVSPVQMCIKCGHIK